MTTIHYPALLPRELAAEQPPEFSRMTDGRVALWLVLCLSVCLLLGGFLSISFEQTERQAKADLHNINLTLESRLNAGLLQPAETRLHSLAMLLEPHLGGPHAGGPQLGGPHLGGPHLGGQTVPADAGRLGAVLQDLSRRFPELPGLTLLNVLGAPVSRASQELASYQNSLVPAGLVQQISQLQGRSTLPELLFATSEDLALWLAVPLRDAQQRPSGWLAAALPLDTVQQLFAQVELGKAGVLTLRRIEPSATVVRQPRLDEMPAVYEPDLIDQQLAAGHDDGVLLMRSRIDGVKRLYSFKRVGSYPFVVVAGYASADYLAEWYFSASIAAGLGGLICLLSLVFCRRLQRNQRKVQRSAAELKAKEEYIRLLLHSVGHPIFGLNLQGQCSFSNQSCRQLLGYADGTDLFTRDLQAHFVNKDGEPSALISQLLASIQRGQEFYCEDHWVIGAAQRAIQVELHAYPNYKNQQLIGAVVTMQDISGRKAQEERISYMAYHDALTGLPNRWRLKERFEQLTADLYSQPSQVPDGQLALLYLDLDHFKHINDSLGHMAGDAVLHAIAKRLQSFKQRIDMVARLGGDEYLLLVRTAQQHEQLKQLLSDLISSIQQPIALDTLQVSVSSSVGVAIHQLHGHDFDALLKAADLALYRAKEDGRNTYRFYHKKMGEQGLRQLTLQTALRQALAKQQLFIEYQPQLDLASGRLVGAEALLRWRHPVEGLISPAEFIPAAESNGLIVPISQWLLQQVCQQAMLWRQQGLTSLVVAVNCSAVQFRQGDLVADVKAALLLSGLPASQLELELTESMLLQDSERVMQVIHELKQLGVQLSIDDFGTGYSNMAYLKKFAVDKLKIDQSFVRGIARNPDDAAIVQSVVTLAHNFHLKAIAEGVEDSDSERILRSLGCDEVQGYLYARPLSVESFDQFVSRQPAPKPRLHAVNAVQ